MIAALERLVPEWRERAKSGHPRRLAERAKSTLERNRSRGSRGDGRQEVLKG